MFTTPPRLIMLDVYIYEGAHCMQRSFWHYVSMNNSHFSASAISKSLLAHCRDSHPFSVGIQVSLPFNSRFYHDRRQEPHLNTELLQVVLDHWLATFRSDCGLFDRKDGCALATIAVTPSTLTTPGQLL